MSFNDCANTVCSSFFFVGSTVTQLNFVEDRKTKHLERERYQYTVRILKKHHMLLILNSFLHIQRFLTIVYLIDVSGILVNYQSSQAKTPTVFRKMDFITYSGRVHLVS